MDILKPIKATAMNRGKPRIWVERDLSSYGFKRGTPVTISVESDRILITADSSGKRIMAGRTKPNGSEVHILDITCPEVDRTRIRNSCAKFRIDAGQGFVIISADYTTKEGL
jgi:hypothetical protein